MSQLEIGEGIVNSMNEILARESKVKLIEEVDKRFDTGEFKELCFRLEVRVEDLSGDTKKSKVRELIEYFDRRNKFSKLYEELKESRPIVNWDHIFSILEPSSNLTIPNLHNENPKRKEFIEKLYQFADGLLFYPVGSSLQDPTLLKLEDGLYWQVKGCVFTIHGFDRFGNRKIWFSLNQRGLEAAERLNVDNSRKYAPDKSHTIYNAEITRIDCNPQDKSLLVQYLELKFKVSTKNLES